MIVRDEERVLERCLRSLAGSVDELCIVDTGSVDRTIEIAKAYGARVSRRVECNGPDGRIRDFSRARNASLRMARGQWVLWIDADEVLRSGAVKIRRRVQQRRFSGIRVRLRWADCEWYSVRLFRRATARFTGRIHEHLHLVGALDAAPEIVIENLPDKEGKESSEERTIRLCRIELAEDPDDRHALFYIGNAYYSAGRMDEAIASYVRFLELGGKLHIQTATAARMIAECHLCKREWDGAIDAGLRALRVDPRYAETHCAIADGYLALKNYALASHWYRSAIACRRPPADGFLFVEKARYGSYPRMRLKQCTALMR